MSNLSLGLGLGITDIPVGMGGIRQLLRLPTWDSTGKFIPGLWENDCNSALLITDHEGNLVNLPVDTIPLVDARYVDIGGGNYDAYNTDALGDPLNPAPSIAHYSETTNLIEESSNWSTWWHQVDSVTVNDALSPDGTVTADKIGELTPVSNMCRGAVTVSIAVGDKYTFSVWVKLTGSGEGDGDFDLVIVRADAGTFEQTLVPCTATSEWQRVEVTHTFGYTHTALACHIQTKADGVTELHVWGAQLEERGFSTPLVPTSGSSATRLITDVQHPYSSAYFNQDSWFAYIDLTPEQAQTALSATDEGILSLADSATNLMFVDDSNLQSTDGTNTAAVDPNYAADTKIRFLAYGDKTADVLGIGYRTMPAGSFAWATEQAYDDEIANGVTINLMFGNEHVWETHAMGMFNKHKGQAYYEANY